MNIMSNPATQQVVDDFLKTGAIPLGPEFDCPYLIGRRARQRCFIADEIDPEIYQALMDRRFRRSGNMFYQPSCRGCTECRPLRVPVADFRPSKSQRRIRHLNRDITTEIQEPKLTEQKWRIYSSYLQYQHDGTMSDEYKDLHNFLYTSPVKTIEIDYYLNDRLVGVSIADRSRETLSSVYMYFDPAFAHRSLGTYSVLWEIDYCRKSGILYYYLGFYVKNCNKMSYKAGFHPHQLLSCDNQWLRVNAPGSLPLGGGAAVEYSTETQ